MRGHVDGRELSKLLQAGVRNTATGFAGAERVYNVHAGCAERFQRFKPARRLAHSHELGTISTITKSAAQTEGCLQNLCIITSHWTRPVVVGRGRPSGYDSRTCKTKMHRGLYNSPSDCAANLILRCTDEHSLQTVSRNLLRQVKACNRIRYHSIQPSPLNVPDTTFLEYSPSCCAALSAVNQRANDITYRR
ncbi:hypothetical protein SCP_0303840 [Sparassis crispa]|uniref:Uncharacterized protein n=1 Tax=Sparassis crispa TaxID=139825 RepID=A0A401GEV9_9APHY|nr:hypothetical protein SCP_0303840 [Sparassis crispa]GBE80665.1 hypothetical protein SCP_0303840 [Sparassis crispa]